MRFTPEELAELAAADAVIDAEFAMTCEELRASKKRDRAAVLEAMDPRARKLAENQRAYYEANREKIAEYQRAYREANREKIAENQRAYREANREKLAEAQRAYREANREKLAEQQKRIADLRREAGMTQLELARKLGVSHSLVSHWETGRAPADWDKLRRVLPELKEV